MDALSLIRQLMGKYLVLSISLAFLTACDSSSDVQVLNVTDEDSLEENFNSQQNPDQSNVFNFGFELRGSPQEDAAQYLSFLKYLSNATGYHFKLHFTPKNSSAAEQLGLGKTQLASMGAINFLIAQKNDNAIALVRGLNQQGKAEYQSLFIVAPNSKIKKITDIKGRRLAFGSQDSTQGHLIPRIMLQKNGLTLKDLKNYSYTGSHQNCAEAVVSGKYEVCGLQDQLAKKLAAKGIVKIIHRSNYYPSSGIVISNEISKNVINTIRKALLEFKPQGVHKQGLYNWNQTEMPNGFLNAKQSDYEELRKWVIEFGFIEDE